MRSNIAKKISKFGIKFVSFDEDQRQLLKISSIKYWINMFGYIGDKPNHLIFVLHSKCSSPDYLSNFSNEE